MTILHAASARAKREYSNVELIPLNRLRPVTAVVVSVAHRDYRPISVEDLCTPYSMPGNPVLINVRSLYDVKSIAADPDQRLGIVKKTSFEREIPGNSFLTAIVFLLFVLTASETLIIVCYDE